MLFLPDTLLHCPMSAFCQFLLEHSEAEKDVGNVPYCFTWFIQDSNELHCNGMP
jgi:hypothetical protein